MRNRLHLDFSIESAEDRTNFVTKYLNSIGFAPSDSELETISNYILWGKNSKGLNPQQEGNITLKEWAPTAVESLEGLSELPGFKETSLMPLTAPRTKIPREVFSRKEALEHAAPHLIPVYNELFHQIDTVELKINFYDLKTGKRTKPPRDSLIQRFNEEELIDIQLEAEELTQYQYLKLKHLLVELRAQQYIISDTQTCRITSHSDGFYTEPSESILDTDIQIFPLGLINSASTPAALFGEDWPRPDQFSDSELASISTLLWRKPTQIFIDFSDTKHILELYKMRDDLADAALADPNGIYNQSKALFDTLQFYEQKAELTDIQQDILNKKLKFTPNAIIAKEINVKYNKSYNENYISTIFHQKIVPAVAQAAAIHKEVAANLFFPENFKKCKDCGRVLLLSDTYFMHQKKSSDGFAPRCKKCEKIKRLSK